MTAFNAPAGGSPDFTAIAQRLDAVGARFRLAEILRALGKFLAIVVPCATATVFAAGFFTLAGWATMSLAVILLGIVVLGYLRLLHGAIFRRPTYAEIARLVEENGAGKLELSNELINAVLLSHDLDEAAQGKTVAGSSWIPLLLRELEVRTSGVTLEKAVPWKQPRNAWLTAGAFVLVCLITILIFPGVFGHGLAVLGRPNTFVPRVGAVKILGVEPGNDTVLAGQSVNFVVTVESPGNKVVEAKIELSYASGKKASLPMSVFGSENNQYRYQLSTAAEDIDYIVTVGDSQSERYHLAVLPQIHLVGYKMDITYPAYTGKDKQSITLTGKDATAAKGSIEAPVGSQVQITTVIDLPVKEALIDVAGGSPIPMMAAGDGRTFSAQVTVKDSLKYAVRLNDASNRTLKRLPDEMSETAGSSRVEGNGNLSFYTIAATPDQAPTVTVSEPARDVDAKPGDKLPLTVQATDDYGVTAVTLETAKNEDKQFKTAQTWPVKAGADGKAMRTVTLKHLLDLPAAEFKFGDTLRYRFVATDNRDLTAIDEKMGPQSTAGQVFTVTFSDTAVAAAKTTKLWDELRKQLEIMLTKQVGLRKQSNDLTAKVSIEDARKVTGAIGEGQKALRADMVTLAKDFPFEPPMKLIQKSLQVLAVEDATSAVDRTSDILLLSDTKALTPLATRLRQHQSRIIDVLQSLLAIAASEENKPSSLVSKDGGDVPNEAKEAWKKLAEDLKKFEKEQKGVIDATTDLAKKPKDQFDQNDEAKLKNIAAMEDKWEKFLNDRLADMSKIAEQDQANVALLEELVQMKVELAMAKNALDTKAVEIATALEDNGMENAKSLTTHIERWLQQQPDRQKWQMEEPVTQKDQAMAELPKQLQDMVGDLMDKEEDLTDDMESQGSKFADSLDKGAGWDAADGPMSNMSAQGVTGNQMPKNMEIQGRSGEGREGRASGEMVGAEAEGKGGRRTPTRMTPEPFASGKVDDKSKDPAGGATGGGKKGQFGGEGLEGSGPDSATDPNQRLQGQQAALRNDAERLQLQMHAAGFNNFKLLEAAVLMKKSEDALRQYHYNSAMIYQQQAVQSLNTAKVLAAGAVHVTMDSTPTVSEKTQKDITDALNGAMPKGYSDPVKAYFQKLAAEDGK